MQRVDGPGAGWLTFGMLGATLLACSRHTIIDLDAFHQMALARVAWTEGLLPHHDVFAYTPTLPVVVHHELGHGALLLALTSLGGAPAVMTLKYALVALVLLLVIRHAVRQGATAAAIAWSLPLGLALLQVGLTTVRAQLVTVALLAALLVVLQADREGRSGPLMAWPIVQLVWGWCHGGVVVGIGVLGLYWVDRAWEAWRSGVPVSQIAYQTRIPMAVAACSPLLLAIGPYGVEYPTYLLRAVTMPRPLIGEWQSVFAGGLSWGVATWLGSVVIALVLLLQDRTRALFPAAVLLVTAALSAKSVRHESLYAVAWLAFVPALLASSPIGPHLAGAWRSGRTAISALFGVVGVLGVAQAVEYRAWALRVPTVSEPGFEGAPVYPQGAVDWLAAVPSVEHVATPFEVGAFVSWKLHPRVLVSLDSRYEAAYPATSLEDSLTLYNAEPGWPAVLEEHDTHAVLTPVHSALADALSNHDPALKQGWTPMYRDDSFLVYVRDDRAAGLPRTDRRGEAIPGRFP